MPLLQVSVVQETPSSQTDDAAGGCWQPAPLQVSEPAQSASVAQWFWQLPPVHVVPAAQSAWVVQAFTQRPWLQVAPPWQSPSPAQSWAQRPTAWQKSFVQKSLSVQLTVGHVHSPLTQISSVHGLLSAQSEAVSHPTAEPHSPLPSPQSSLGHVWTHTSVKPSHTVVKQGSEEDGQTSGVLTHAPNAESQLFMVQVDGLLLAAQLRGFSSHALDTGSTKATWQKSAGASHADGGRHSAHSQRPPQSSGSQ
jgi:hypothetical protein